MRPLLGSAVVAVFLLLAAVPASARPFQLVPIDATPLGVVEGATNMAVADLNGDGHLDAVAGAAPFAAFAAGLGGLSAAPLAVTPAGFRAAFVTAADVNGDGLADVVMTQYSPGALAVFLSDRSGGFSLAPGSPLAVGRIAWNPVIADFDSDRRPDIAVALGADGEFIGLGDGTGRFVAGGRISAGSVPLASTSADLNGDGRPDLAVADYETSAVAILLGDGHGGFTRHPAPASLSRSAPDAVVSSDFNEDGRADLALTNASAFVPEIGRASCRERV